MRVITSTPLCKSAAERQLIHSVERALKPLFIQAHSLPDLRYRITRAMPDMPFPIRTLGVIPQTETDRNGIRSVRHLSPRQAPTVNHRTAMNDPELNWRTVTVGVEQDTGHRVVILSALYPAEGGTLRIWREDHWDKDTMPEGNALLHQVYWYTNRDVPFRTLAACVKEALQPLTADA
jgi:hypothetical protein